MKALLLQEFGAPDRLSLDELPNPVAGPGELVIDVHFASVGFADLLVIAGKYQKLPVLPFVPGKECAGIVREAGAGVDQLKPGDRVSVHIERGAFSQAVLARVDQCDVIPDGMDMKSAAALGSNYLTAHFALFERAQLKHGEVVLITGAAGGIGLAAVQIAKAHRAIVLAAVSNPEKAKAATDSGADHIIDTSRPDLRNSLRDQVFAAVGERGADVILDNVGGDVFDAALRAIAWSGRMLVIGFTSGRIPEVKAGVLLVKNIAVIGMQISDYRDRRPERVNAVRRELISMHAEGHIRPQIKTAVPLERFAEAFALAKDRQTIGKVLLVANP